MSLTSRYQPRMNTNQTQTQTKTPTQANHNSRTFSCMSPRVYTHVKESEAALAESFLANEVEDFSFCEQNSFLSEDEGGYIPHEHTADGWRITLDDPFACRCNGLNYQQRINAINGRVSQLVEIVDVPVDYFQEVNYVQGGVEDIMKHVSAYLHAMGVTQAGVDKKVSDIVHSIFHAYETFMISYTFLQRAQDWGDLWVVFINAFKLITGKTAMELTAELAKARDWVVALVKNSEWMTSDENPVQGFVDDIGFIRQGFETFKKIKKNALVKTFGKLLRYCLAFGLFTKVGLSFENLQYSEVETAYIKEKFSHVQGFAEELIEGTLFFLERAAQAIALKSWSPFLYNSASMGSWSDKAFEIKNHYRMYQANNNEEVTYSSILNEVLEAISNGEALLKIPGIDTATKTLAQRLLLDLRYIHCEIVSVHNNQKTRIPPFAEMVVGDSSVGKTLFTVVLGDHFARVFGLPTGEEFTYHRNAGETHWNGYKPFMHTLVYDDVGAHNPRKVMGVDVGIGELVPVINSNAMGANMADLSEKGRSPIKPAHVIVNSNIEDMHANVYYSFPLALMRRLPYIIRISPRVDPAEGIDYRVDSSPSMLDPAKLPPLMPGEYPNQWNIKVKHVIAKAGAGDASPQVGFDGEAEFTDIYKFLEWYNAVLEEHKRMSFKMSQTLETMRDESWRDTWCIHHLPAKHCTHCANNLQGPLEEGENSSADSVSEESLHDAVETFAADAEEIFEDEGICGLVGDLSCMTVILVNDWVRKIRSGVAKIADIASEKLRAWVASCIKTEACKMLQEAGSKVWDTIISSSPLRWALYAIGALAGAAILAQCFTWATTEDDAIQGPASSKYGKPSVVENPDSEANPWYNKEMKMSSFDVPTLTSSWKGKDEDEIRKLVSPNIIAFSLEAKNGQTLVTKYSQLHAVCLGGHLYVTNNHFIPQAEEYFMHIVHGEDSAGININKDETLGPSSWFRFPERDLVFFMLHLPPRQDLRAMVPRGRLPIYCEGMYVQRDIQGYISKKHVYAVAPAMRVHVQVSENPMDVWEGRVDEKTVNGDCGAALVGLTSVGPLLMGLHVAGGRSQEVEAAPLDSLVVEEAIRHFGIPIISCNTINLAPKDVVGPLHPKSIFRFAEKGHARVFGSVPTRASMRSKVGPSLLAPALKKRGLVERHGAPVMKGWKPWAHAVLPCTQHKGRIRNDILRQAGDAYLGDIKKKIPQEEIDTVQILDDLEALNGVPGVKYLEGINRSTSMGYPYQKSKKFFLMETDDERWQDGVTYAPEVWDEIDRMVKDYESGRVTNPVFVGQLKDEAIEHRKIIIGKTRVFLISSAAWTLVMRKFYLRFVRLFQRYRKVFEGMPGLRTQSSAWGKLRAYLTAFGEDRLFAGDFGKYDKMLEAVMNIEAFRIIFEVARMAGWDELSLMILWAIAEDASFPTALVNGDLIQLEGSNPSGQALTVIINCIANSLYMRYVYIIRNPEHEALTFQEFVHLATYGDDNGGGVSRLIDWFNHTAIQEEMAKIGVEYTMADKTSVSRPFIHIDEVEFLKRKWRYEPEVDDYFAPLNESSIEKRLMVGVQSSELTPEWQAVENMKTSMEDYFFYGREVFEQKKQFLLEVGRESGLEYHMENIKWPQFDDLLQRWKEADGELSAEDVDDQSL